jgi:hypothetical protein
MFWNVVSAVSGGWAPTMRRIRSSTVTATRRRDLPLLVKGDDLARTDVRPARP